MIVLHLALRSLANRWVTALLTVLAIATSVMLLLGVERMRTSARQSFADTIAGTDLIVGARTGAIQLLLYSVFRIGNATNNITWTSVSDIARHPDVDWIVPLSLGDSHRGFRVVGTTRDYFERVKVRRRQALSFTSGQAFSDLFDAVIGAEVAVSLGYRIGDQIVIGHGLGDVSFLTHDDKPFRIAGILERTGTPVDRAVHVSLEAIEAIHVDWQSGVPNPGAKVDADAVRAMDLKPKAVTAALVGLKSRLATFRVQRAINDYRAEPLLAILPGATLQELWGLVGTAETALAVISIMVVVTALLGMVTMILTTLNERRREMAILRSVGAGPRTIMAMLMAEAGALTLIGVACGVAMVILASAAFGPYLEQAYGLAVPIALPTAREGVMLAAIVAGGVLAGLLPAWRAYRLSLADGMMVRS